MIGFKTASTLLATAAVLSLAPISNAEAATFTGSSTNPEGNSTLSAIAEFLVAGNQLSIKLTNSGSEATRPSDLLTAIFWDIKTTPTTLSYQTGTAPTVTSTNSSPSPQSNVDLRNVGGNEEWRYAFNAVNLPGLTQSYGLGTAGFGVFSGGGGGQQFEYGIANGVSASANTPTQDAFLVNNTATFVLSGLPNGFSDADITNVRFQYGTDLKQPSFQGVTDPIPTPALLPGLIGMGVAALRKRKGEAEESNEA